MESRIWLAVVPPLLVAACAGGPEDPPITGPEDLRKATTLLVEPTELRFESLGETGRLTVRVLDQNGSQMPTPANWSWSSRDPGVATVGIAGHVSATGNGVTTIRAAAGDLVDSATVVVEQVGDSLVIVRHPVTLFGMGDTVQLSTSVLDAGGTPLEGFDVAWSVVDPSVASITAHGLITGGNPGSTTLEVLAEGLTGTVSLRNTDLPLQRQTLAVSLFDACAISNLGNAYCWDASQLVPPGEPVSTEVGIISVSMSTSHACGLSGVGQAYCWMSWGNARSFLGDGTTNRSETPVAVDASETFVQVSAGTEHSCAVTLDGTGYCWGSNNRGQLGDGTTEDRLSPTPVSGSLAFQAIEAGAAHSCGLTNDGAAYCWGFNLEGQVGDGSTTDRHEPVPVSGGLEFTTLSVGTRISCGLTETGEAHCWGLNDEGQLGDATRVNRLVPTEVVGGRSFISIAAGSHETCAIGSDAVPYCWGSIALGGSTVSLEPVAIPASTPFGHVANTHEFPCALTHTADVYCWGGRIGLPMELAPLDFAVAIPR